MAYLPLVFLGRTSIFAAAVLLVVFLHSDLRQRRLPNNWVALYAVLCPVALWLAEVTPAIWLQHGIIALMGFALFLMFFIMGGMGGGDVKLATAVLGWAGVQALVPTLFVIAISGLVLAALGVLADRLLVVHSKRRSSSGFKGWQAVLHALSAKRGVPYGVALALGGIATLPAYWR